MLWNQEKGVLQSIICRAQRNNKISITWKRNFPTNTVDIKNLQPISCFWIRYLHCFSYHGFKYRLGNSRVIGYATEGGHERAMNTFASREGIPHIISLSTLKSHIFERYIDSVFISNLTCFQSCVSFFSKFERPQSRHKLRSQL